MYLRERCGPAPAPPILSMLLISTSLGGSLPCGPSCYLRHVAEPLPTHSITLFIAVPNIPPEDIPSDTLADAINLIRNVRDRDDCHVTLVADMLDDRPKREWAALFTAKAIWSRAATKAHLETRALISSPNDAVKLLWTGNLSISNAIVPGFRLFESTKSGNDIRDIVPVTNAEARLIAVLPRTLAIGAILNSRDELELRIDNECTSATSYFCAGWAESGSSMLLEIGSSRFIARARKGTTPFIADVAPVRDLSKDLTEALDMCALRRDRLGVIERSRLRRPHPDISSRLPTLEIQDGVLIPVSKSSESWTDDKQFEQAVNRLAHNSDAKKPGLRPSMHHTQAAKLERLTLKRRYTVPKRPRGAVPKLSEPTKHEEQVTQKCGDEPKDVGATVQTSVQTEADKKELQVEKESLVQPRQIDKPLVEFPIATALGGALPCGPSCYHHDVADTPPANVTTIFIAVPNNPPADIPSDSLADSIKLIRDVRGRDDCEVTIVADVLDDRPKREWSALLCAKSIWSRATAKSHLETRALVTPPNDTMKQIWMGKLAISGAIVPGFRLIESVYSKDDIRKLIPVSSGEARLVAVLPRGLVIGAILNSCNELELQIDLDCTSATTYFCTGWADCGSSLLLQIGDTRFIARARKGTTPFVADVAPLRELSENLAEALDMCTLRREKLGVAERTILRRPHPDIGSRLPLLEISDGVLKPVKNWNGPWINGKQFEHAVSRLAVNADAEKPGLRPPMHHSEAAKLERLTVKRRYAFRKRPRSATVLPLRESGESQQLPAQKIVGTTEKVGCTVAPKSGLFQGPMKSTDLVKHSLRRSQSQTPGSGRGTPGTKNMSGSISMRGIMTARSVATSDDLLRTTGSDSANGKSVAALRMDRKARLQRQLAARTANAQREPKTVRRRSLELERSRSLRRKYPDVMYRGALECGRKFLDCTAAARVNVKDVEFMNVPMGRDECFVTHGVEFALMTKDRRDEVLQRYEKEVARTEQEHSSAWSFVGRRGALERISAAVTKLSTPGGEVFGYAQPVGPS